MAAFSDTTNLNGLVQKIDFLLFGSSTANTTEFPLKDKAREVNEWYRKVMGWIFEVAGNWSFDDSNYTNLPIAKTDCVLDQHDYVFPSDYVEIEEIHYKDSSGIWHELIPLDRKEISGVGTPESGVIGGVVNQASEEFLKTSGTPKYYDKFANSFWLYPAPNRTSTDGDSLRVYHTRDASYTTTTSNTGGPFSSTDDSKSPGFNVLWHPVLAYGAAYNYAIANVRTDKIQVFLNEIERFHQMIQQHYARRKKDESARIVPLYQNSR